MTELPFYFRRDDKSLFAVAHEPAAGAVPSPLGFVFSHPFGEEKLWSHRVFVTFARELAVRGHYVLRFDYTGAGDSTGATEQASLETHLADLGAAIGQLQTRYARVRRIGLVGLRLGATFAALFAERASDAGSFDCIRRAPLVLWDPILDGDSYFQELLRSNLSTQLSVFGKVVENREALVERIRAGGTANVDGYEIGSSLLESCARADLLSRARLKHDGPCLVVQVAASEKQKTRDELAELAQACADGRFMRAIEQPFWREIKPFYGRAPSLQSVTLEWLEQHRA